MAHAADVGVADCLLSAVAAMTFVVRCPLEGGAAMLYDLHDLPRTGQTASHCKLYIFYSPSSCVCVDAAVSACSIEPGVEVEVTVADA